MVPSLRGIMFLGSETQQVLPWGWAAERANPSRPPSWWELRAHSPSAHSLPDQEGLAHPDFGGGAFEPNPSKPMKRHPAFWETRNLCKGTERCPGPLKPKVKRQEGSQRGLV